MRGDAQRTPMSDSVPADGDRIITTEPNDLGQGIPVTGGGQEFGFWRTDGSATECKEWEEARPRLLGTRHARFIYF